MKGIYNYSDVANKIIEILIKESESIKFRIKNAMKIAKDLHLEREAFFGAIKQSEVLDNLIKELITTNKNETFDQFQIGARLRNVFSLYPNNLNLLNAIYIIFRIKNLDVINKIQREISDFLVVHISCESRIDKSLQSIESFSPTTPSESHIILMGCDTADDFKISFLNNTIYAPVDDSYSGLYAKTMYLSFILSSLPEPPRLMAKLDDDICLNNRSQFDKVISNLMGSEYSYFGYPVLPNHHKNYWHGWHVGKCSSPKVEMKGIQVPLPAKYAVGGAGYFLKKSAIKELSYCFLSQQEFISANCFMPEDALVGLHLQLAGYQLGSLREGYADNVGLSGRWYHDFNERCRDWAKFIPP